MIDLSTKKPKEKELWKIRLESGVILKVKRPTQRILNTLSELQNETDTLEIIKQFSNMVTIIFNRNINGMEFTIDEIEEMIDIEQARDIVQDYLEFTVSQLKN